jgi:hypothetical protein
MTHRVEFMFRLDEKTNEECKKIAAEVGRSKNYVLEWLIQEGLRKYKKAKRKPLIKLSYDD